jgi:hypothetical protein
VAGSRETGRTAPLPPALAQHVQGNKLIYNDKDRSRTARGNTGRFRFAQGRWLRLALVDAATDEISYNQGRLEIQGRLRPDMLDPAATPATQEVEA